MTEKHTSEEVEQLVYGDLMDAESIINGGRRPFVERVMHYCMELLDKDNPMHVIGHIESECRDYENLIRIANEAEDKKLGPRWRGSICTCTEWAVGEPMPNCPNCKGLGRQADLVAVSMESVGQNVVQVGSERHHLGEDGEVVMIETSVEVGHSGSHIRGTEHPKSVGDGYAVVSIDAVDRALTDKYATGDVLKILSNVGIDTKCGACMEIAFTGVTMAAHECTAQSSSIVLSEDDQYPWEDSTGQWMPGTFKSSCRYCCNALVPEHRRIADGCPCNSPRGINHGLVPKNTCTCVICDLAQTGGTRYPVQADG